MKMTNVQVATIESDTKKYKTKREYRFYTGFDDNSCNQFYTFLYEYKTFLEDFKPIQKKEIKIFINSGGGYITPGLECFFLIDELKKDYDVKIITINNGLAYSMASCLFCLGDERLMKPLSALGFHSMSGGVFGKIQEMSDGIAFANQLNNTLEKLINDCNPNFGLEKYHTLVTENKAEYVLYGNEAVDAGWATGMI